MLAKKKSVQKNFSEVDEKISADDSMTLQKDELKNFQDEIQKQIEAGNKIIDIAKAIRNAKYLTKLDIAFADTEGTTMTFEEVERLINA